MVILRARNKITDFLMILAWASPFNPANTKHLYNIWTMLNQRRRRFAVVVQMLYNIIDIVFFKSFLSNKHTNHLVVKETACYLDMSIVKKNHLY